MVEQLISSRNFMPLILHRTRETCYLTFPKKQFPMKRQQPKTLEISLQIIIDNSKHSLSGKKHIYKDQETSSRSNVCVRSCKLAPWSLRNSSISRSLQDFDIVKNLSPARTRTQIQKQRQKKQVYSLAKVTEIIFSQNLSLEGLPLFILIHQYFHLVLFIR